MMPTVEQARQFALMLQVGVPAREAITYFLPEEFPQEQLPVLAEQWARSRVVLEAMVVLQKGEWTRLTPEARIKLALEKHYNEMAYFLYTNNYCEVDGGRKTKADECRRSLESKVAGMAGKEMAPLLQLYQDLVDKRKAGTNVLAKES